MVDDTILLPLVGGEAKRRCRKCWVPKSIEEFERKGSDRQRGRICKECRNATRDVVDNRRRVKEWRKAHPEKVSEYGRRNYDSRRSDVVRWLAATLRTTRANCKKRGIECSVTPAELGEIYEAQGGKCALTGRMLAIGSRGHQRDSISLDRIEAGGPYSKENVRLTTFQANMARGPFPDEELVAFCQAVLRTREMDELASAAENGGGE